MRSAYVPLIASCKVLEEYPTGLLREITLKDKPDSAQERVEFFPIGNVRDPPIPCSIAASLTVPDRSSST